MHLWVQSGHCGCLILASAPAWLLLLLLIRTLLAGHYKHLLDGFHHLSCAAFTCTFFPGPPPSYLLAVAAAAAADATAATKRPPVLLHLYRLLQLPHLLQLDGLAWLLLLLLLTHLHKQLVPCSRLHFLLQVLHLLQLSGLALLLLLLLFILTLLTHITNSCCPALTCTFFSRSFTFLLVRSCSSSPSRPRIFSFSLRATLGRMLASSRACGSINRYNT
jgi:hypothetical protein